MKYCVFCNNPIEDNATYCMHCGKQQPAMYTPPQQPQQSNNNNLLYLLIGILGTALLIIGGFLLYNMLSDNNAKEDEAAEQKRDTVVTVVNQPQQQAAPQPAAPPKVYTIPGNHHMSGSISKYGITMDINVSGSDVYGTYYYHSVGSKNRMTVTGNIYGNNMYLEEYSPDGLNTGNFQGTFNGRVFKGKFTNYDKGSYLSFTLTEK